MAGDDVSQATALANKFKEQGIDPSHAYSKDDFDTEFGQVF